jgi:phage FluMu protein Com
MFSYCPGCGTMFFGNDVYTCTHCKHTLEELDLSNFVADVCPVCDGKRQDPAFSQIPVKCPACNGTGLRG